MNKTTLARAAALLVLASTVSFSAAAFDPCTFLGITDMPFFCPAP